MQNSTKTTGLNEQHVGLCLFTNKAKVLDLEWPRTHLQYRSAHIAEIFTTPRASCAMALNGPLDNFYGAP